MRIGQIAFEITNYKLKITNYKSARSLLVVLLFFIFLVFQLEITN